MFKKHLGTGSRVSAYLSQEGETHSVMAVDDVELFYLPGEGGLPHVQGFRACTPAGTVLTIHMSRELMRQLGDFAASLDQEEQSCRES